MTMQEKTCKNTLSKYTRNARYSSIRMVYNEVYSELFNQGKTDFLAHIEAKKMLSERFGPKRVATALYPL